MTSKSRVPKASSQDFSEYAKVLEGNMKRTFPLFVVLGLFVTVCTSAPACCASNTNTYTLLATSESRMSGGFSFTVSVSNTHPRLGEKVIIKTELQNVYNTSVVIQDIEGETSIRITNEGGELVWGIVRERTGTTLTNLVAIGSKFGGDIDWTVVTDPAYTVQVTPGIYTISVSDTGLYGPVSDMQTPFSVTPIQITVTN
jgi:hypothetical protein